MKALTYGDTGIELRGSMAFSSTVDDSGVTVERRSDNVWKYGDGAHAATDSFGVKDMGAYRVVYYTLDSFDVQGWWSCIPCAYAVADRSLEGILKKDKNLLTSEMALIEKREAYQARQRSVLFL